MRAVLALAAALVVAFVRAQDSATPVSAIGDVTAVSAIDSTPVPVSAINGATPVSAMPDDTETAATTVTTCLPGPSATVPVSDPADVDPLNPPSGWVCYKIYPIGGGMASVPIYPDTATTDGHDDNLKIILPASLIGGALVLMAIALTAFRLRARRASKLATTRPWFKRHTWVEGRLEVAVDVEKQQQPQQPPMAHRA